MLFIAGIMSWVILVLGLIGFWLALKHPAGWLITLLREGGFLAYGFLTGDYAFVLAAILFGAIFVRNYHKDDRRIKVECDLCGRIAPKHRMLRLGDTGWKCKRPKRKREEYAKAHPLRAELRKYIVKID